MRAHATTCGNISPYHASGFMAQCVEVNEYKSYDGQNISLTPPESCISCTMTDIDVLG
jgi:hypothetical protein